MIITGSSIGMDSARTYTSVKKEATYQGKVTTATFLDSLKNNYTGSGLKTLDEVKVSDTEESDKSENALDNFNEFFSKMRTLATSDEYEERLKADFRNKLLVQCIQYLLNLLLHKGIDKDSITPVSTSGTEGFSSVSSGQFSIGVTSVESTYISYEHEEETTSFSTNGKVVTSDGREIDFNLDLTMSRSFTQYYRNTITATTGYIDPLVINLDSPYADVSDVKISFDLDCDGKEDQINMLSASSGYLALDKNNDGHINDGSELFGTRSGDGFRDLAAYDRDNNGWIDENDEIFNKLKICVMNEDGSQTLYQLKDKGVGAIYLGSSDTEFSLNDFDSNENLAKIRKTGIFLYENGSVGTVQHLDLAQ